MVFVYSVYVSVYCPLLSYWGSLRAFLSLFVWQSPYYHSGRFSLPLSSSTCVTIISSSVMRLDAAVMHRCWVAVTFSTSHSQTHTYRYTIAGGGRLVWPVCSSHVCQNAVLHEAEFASVDRQPGSLQNRLHIGDIPTQTHTLCHMPPILNAIFPVFEGKLVCFSLQRSRIFHFLRILKNNSILAQSPDSQVIFSRESVWK